MEHQVKVLLKINNEKVFGPGPYQLLKKIDECGSLNLAASELKISYTKAFNMIKNIEKLLSIKVTEKQIGGVGGGGSLLTEDAYKLINKYEIFEEEVRNYANKRFEEIFE